MRAGLWTVTALALVAALVSGILLWRNDSSGCSGRETVRVAAEPAIADALTGLADLTAADGSCFDYAIESIAGGYVPELLTRGEGAPELWVADSQSKARRVIAQTRRGSGFVAESLATTPAVVVGTDPGTYPGWVDVLRRPNLQIGSPVSSTAADAPIVGSLAAELSGRLTRADRLAAMAGLADRRNRAVPMADPKSTDESRLMSAGATASVVVTSEQQFMTFKRHYPNSSLISTVPSDGTVLLDYPLVNTAGSDQAADAGVTLLKAARSQAGRKILTGQGFRAPDGTGVGKPVKTLTIDPARVDAAVDEWTAMALPTRTILALDVSTSLRMPAADSTRAALVIDGALGWLRQLPPNTDVGMWIYSLNKGGNGQDWLETVPSRRLGDPVRSWTQRDILDESINRSLKAELGGGRALYDTILAGYKAVLNGYDADYTNTLTIVTDGRDDDLQGPTPATLIDQLKRLADPGRPVRVVVLGVSADVDRATLTTITNVTGGGTSVTADPYGIQGLFAGAVRPRLSPPVNPIGADGK
ncbi:hypothetical protein M2359_001557 [Gordonia amarae]|uniref:VWFA domain-containing protein n=1 Tax=Gordonia amarae NBRC 15530 TaxID=1075090 RepID=G7GSA3_9ACTN|nr:substrate-binding domain-containing protein [Gordonia amarae]MCS3877928.1 hypothetical protein [Gordonia amarae]GAB06467.1 hypothetical protein GOAMR_52_00640 [Gordonia amarae NBRC 15530]